MINWLLQNYDFWIAWKNVRKSLSPPALSRLISIKNGIKYTWCLLPELKFCSSKRGKPSASSVVSTSSFIWKQNKTGHERLAMKDSFIRTTKAMDRMDKHRNTAGQIDKELKEQITQQGLRASYMWCIQLFLYNQPAVCTTTVRYFHNVIT